MCLTYRTHLSVVNEYNGCNDVDSDESNFEAFDDESPLILNDHYNLQLKSGTNKHSSVKISQTPELGEFDNRRFFR